jgi:hypothetical protein
MMGGAMQWPYCHESGRLFQSHRHGLEKLLKLLFISSYLLPILF